ncbi:MAG: hypothetical protein FXF54_04740 [Kosmotoga sp.]|nr:MAG: hypothetical protein FXF54_04740 [Kosmotoga sp.]
MDKFNRSLERGYLFRLPCNFNSKEWIKFIIDNRKVNVFNIMENVKIEILRTTKDQANAEIVSLWLSPSFDMNYNINEAKKYIPEGAIREGGAAVKINISVYTRKNIVLFSLDKFLKEHSLNKDSNNFKNIVEPLNAIEKLQSFIQEFQDLTTNDKKSEIMFLIP